MNTDQKNSLDAKIAFNSASITSDTTTAGNVIDTAGFDSLTFLNTIGTVTDGTYTPKIEESDESGSGFAAVDSANLTNTLASAALSASNTISKIGVSNFKRYVKFSYVSASTSSGATHCHSVAVLGNPKHAPVA